MRIVFDFGEELEGRLRKQIDGVDDSKIRNFIGKQALEEWLTRKEGRDKRGRLEQLAAIKSQIRPILEELLADVQSQGGANETK